MNGGLNALKKKSQISSKWYSNLRKNTKEPATHNKYKGIDKEAFINSDKKIAETL